MAVDERRQVLNDLLLELGPDAGVEVLDWLDANGPTSVHIVRKWIYAHPGETRYIQERIVTVGPWREYPGRFWSRRTPTGGRTLGEVFVEDETTSVAVLFNGVEFPGGGTRRTYPTLYEAHAAVDEALEEVGVTFAEEYRMPGENRG